MSMELADAADLGLEGRADGCEEVVEGGVVGELAGCAAGCADVGAGRRGRPVRRL